MFALYSNTIVPNFLHVQVLDLLEIKEKPLQIVEDHQKRIVVPDLAEKVIENVHQFNELFGPASNNRYTQALPLYLFPFL